jgi:hypothetical protein
MSNGTFDFNAFISESKETLLNPKSYFSSMKTSGGFTEPLIKAVIYGTVAGIIYLIWGFLRLGVYTGLFGGAVGFMVFVWSIISSVIGLFIGAVVLLIISSICKGNSEFEANLRVTASVMVVMPVAGLLSFATPINAYLGLVVSLLVAAYSLWLLYNGLVEALKCDAGTAKIVCYVIIAIMALFLLLGLSARSRASRLLNEYNKGTTEILKDLNK